MKETRIFTVLPVVHSCCYCGDVLIVPLNFVFVICIFDTIDFQDLSVVLHSESNVVEREIRVLVISRLMMDGSEGFVPISFFRTGADLFNRQEFICHSSLRVDLEDQRFKISESKENKFVVIIQMATRDCCDCKTDVIVELAPSPVTIEVDGVGESMVSSNWCKVFRSSVTGDDDLLVEFIVKGACNVFIFRTSRRDWKDFFLTFSCHLIPTSSSCLSKRCV